MRLIQILESLADALLSAAIFATVGITIGIGELLASGATLTPRVVVGRAIITGGLATAAGAVLVWVPDLPLAGQIGVAAALASLGTSGLERIFVSVVGARQASDGRGQ